MQRKVKNPRKDYAHKLCLVIIPIPSLSLLFVWFTFISFSLLFLQLYLFNMYVCMYINNYLGFYFVIQFIVFILNYGIVLVCTHTMYICEYTYICITYKNQLVRFLSIIIFVLLAATLNKNLPNAL